MRSNNTRCLRDNNCHHISKETQAINQSNASLPHYVSQLRLYASSSSEQPSSTDRCTLSVELFLLDCILNDSSLLKSICTDLFYLLSYISMNEQITNAFIQILLSYMLVSLHADIQNNPQMQLLKYMATINSLNYYDYNISVYCLKQR